MKLASDGHKSIALKIARRLRSNPHVWSRVCRGLRFFNTRVLGAGRKSLYQRHLGMFEPTEFVRKHSNALRSQGYTVIPNFVSAAECESILENADVLFLENKIDHKPHYKSTYQSLKDIPYQELARTQKRIGLHKPLINIPGFVDIAFHETILSIVANTLGYIPPYYGTGLLRDFPHSRPRESSNFHKDNEETDVIQIYTYLVDADDSHGRLVFVPGSHQYDVKSCRPRLNRDQGIDANDGLYSDDEVRKYYDEDEWAVVSAKSGSVVLFYGSGLHKGPVWANYSNPNNQPRTALYMDAQSFSVGRGVRNFDKRLKIGERDFDRLSSMQRLFLDAYEIVESTVPAPQQA